jgi:hypothetical protein
MADRDYSCKLLLVEDNQNDLESTLAVLSEGRTIEGVFMARDGEEHLGYFLRRTVYRSQAADDPITGLLGLNDQPSSAAKWEL